MLTLQEFITKYLGKKVDFDGAYSGQCVDLARQYFQDVLGISQPKGVTGAADFWTNYDSDPNLHNNFDKIHNTPTFVPNPGDVVLWNKKAGGGFGHVAIFIEGDVNQFTSLDQNWPTLDKVTKTPHNYTNVYGVFRPKKKLEPGVVIEYPRWLSEAITNNQKDIQERHSGNVEGWFRELQDKASDGYQLDRVRGELEETHKELNLTKSALQTSEKIINEYKLQTTGLETQVKVLTADYEALIDALWRSLSPLKLVGDKNEATILGEIEKLISTEDGCEKVVRALDTANVRITELETQLRNTKQEPVDYSQISLRDAIVAFLLRFRK